MELQTAIEILEYHQEWRIGKREDMIYEPKKLTMALDIVLSEVKKFRLNAVMRSFTACPRCGSDKIYFEGWWTCRECTHDWGGK